MCALLRVFICEAQSTAQTAGFCSFEKRWPKAMTVLRGWLSPATVLIVYGCAPRDVREAGGRGGRDGLVDAEFWAVVAARIRYPREVSV